LSDVFGDVDVGRDLSCRCGCGRNSPHPELLRVLDAIEVSCGGAVHIISGHRCAAHNRRVGGAVRSRHLTGEASDIYINGWSGERLRAEIVALFGPTCYSYVIGWRAVHVDVRGRV
jgi:uncharacterized protein YcbK (DUF882 family)